VRKGKDFALIHHADADGSSEFPISIVEKLQVIGKDQIVQRSLVSVELLFVSVLFGSGEVSISDVFGFDVAYRNSFFIRQNVIRRTAGLTLGFVGGGDIWHEGFEEILEITPKGMLGGIAEAVAGIEGMEVIGCGHEKRVVYTSECGPVCFQAGTHFGVGHSTREFKTES
jgi:hypothetical protein